MKKKRDRILRRCVSVYSSHSTRRRPCQWRPTDSGCSSSNERHGKIIIHFFVNLINQSINEIVKLAVSDRRPRSVWNTVGSVVSSRVNILIRRNVNRSFWSRPQSIHQQTDRHLRHPFIISFIFYYLQHLQFFFFFLYFNQIKIL